MKSNYKKKPKSWEDIEQQREQNKLKARNRIKLLEKERGYKLRGYYNLEIEGTQLKPIL